MFIGNMTNISFNSVSETFIVCHDSGVLMFSHTDTVEISNYITFVDCRRTTFVEIKKLRIHGSRFVSQYI